MARVKVELTGSEASPRQNHLRISEVGETRVGNAEAYIASRREQKTTVKKK